MLTQRWEVAPFRSEKLRAYANGQACVCCGAQDGTVVLAHLPMQGISPGGSSKCDDFVSAFLCGRCHHEADHGEYRTDVFWRYQMNVRTLKRLFVNGKVRVV